MAFNFPFPRFSRMIISCWMPLTRCLNRSPLIVSRRSLRVCASRAPESMRRMASCTSGSRSLSSSREECSLLRMSSQCWAVPSRTLDSAKDSGEDREYRRIRPIQATVYPCQSLADLISIIKGSHPPFDLLKVDLLKAQHQELFEKMLPVFEVFVREASRIFNIFQSPLKISQPPVLLAISSE